MQFPLVFREALPYLKEFGGKIFLVKTGGKVMEDMDFPQLVHDLSTLRLLGIQLILVLGSGPQFDRILTERGIPFKKINGRRVTTPEMISILRDITAKQMENICDRFREDGIEAVNVSDLLRAEKFFEPGFPTEHCTGTITGVDTEAIATHLQAGKLPISFSLIGGFNCNADDVSLALARALSVEKALFLTGSKGVFVEDRERGVSALLSSATPDEIEAYIKNGRISGGMVPKVLAAAAVVRAGIPKAHVVSGLLDGSVLLEVFTLHGTGTMIARNISPNEK